MIFHNENKKEDRTFSSILFFLSAKLRVIRVSVVKKNYFGKMDYTEIHGEL
jgi:hypothetical protein